MAITINGKQYDENKIDQNIKNSIGQVQFLQRRMNELQLDFDRSATATEIFDKLENLETKINKILKLLEKPPVAKKKTVVKK